MERYMLRYLLRAIQISILAALVIVAYVTMFMGAGASDAQLPRPHRPDGSKRPILNSLQARQYVAGAGFTRVVTVDANGNGDYSTLSAAFAAVAAKTDRAGFSRYLILIYPGDGTSNQNAIDGYNFQESALVVPDFTTVQGVAAPAAAGGNYAGHPVIRMTGTSGPLFVVGNQSGLVDLDLKIATTTLTADTQLLAVQPTAGGSGAGAATLTNVQLFGVNVADNGFNLSLLRVNNTTDLAHSMLLVATDVSTSRQGTGVGPNARNVEQVGQAAALFYQGWHTGRTQGQLIYANPSISSMALRLFGVRLDTGVIQLTNAGPGTLSQVGSPYTTSSGVITDEAVRAASITFSAGAMDLAGTGSPEGVATAPVGSVWHRTDGGAGTSFYVKESGSSNTGWVGK